jgi:glucosamine--fructose-6-phosphate aminotransferase (isomerizing)
MDVASEYRYRDPVVGPDDLVIGISQSGETADTLAAMRLARERGATVLAVATEGDTHVAEHAEEVLYVPRTDWLLQPLLAVVPLQLLAYYIARDRGLNVDQPRNLAKTVTVE